MKRLQRLMSVALVLAARKRLRAAELARQFRISERTVYRDISALQEAGFPVEGNAGDGYRVPLDAFLRPLALSEPEAEALTMAAQLLGTSADERLRELLGSATAKLESVLAPEAKRRVRQHHAEVLIPSGSQKPEGPLGLVLDALRTREVLRITYDAVTGQRSTDREIEPLGLVRLEDAWLLIAYCRARQDVRAFRVDRIRKTRGTGEAFAPRSGMSFAEVLDREQAKRNPPRTSS